MRGGCYRNASTRNAAGGEAGLSKRGGYRNASTERGGYRNAPTERGGYRGRVVERIRIITRRVKGYRTIALSLVISILGFLQTFDFTPIIANPKTVGLLLMGIGLLMAILRGLTDTRIGYDR